MRCAAAAGLALLVGCSAGPDPRAGVHDGFEGRRLSGIWSTDRFAPGAVVMQSAVVRAGHGAARVILRHGDVFERGANGGRDTERAELAEAERWYSGENQTWEYRFSQYLSADFPIVPVRLVLAQWKQYCNGAPPCEDDSPVVALRYVSGRLAVTLNAGRRQTTLFEAAGDLRGRWTDWRFQIHFTPGPGGVVRAWRNGEQIVDYRGPSAYAENASTGYRSPSLFYFKMGLYRDTMAEPMTIYLDEYWKRPVAE